MRARARRAPAARASARRVSQRERDLERERDELRDVAATLHWMARRYADHRGSYAAGLLNDCVRKLLRAGVRLVPTADDTVWARDQQGRAFDGLSDAEATPGTPEARGERP